MKKHKVLDVRMPKEDQDKLKPVLKQKKYQVDVRYRNGKVRYMYGNDPDILESFARAKGLKIVKVTKLD